MTVNYDAEGDILRIQLAPTAPSSRMREAGDGVLLEVDRDSTRVTGVEIWNLAARSARGECIEIDGIVTSAERKSVAVTQ